MSGKTGNRPVWLCVFLWTCLLFFPRPSPAETPAKPQKPTDEETLKRILANWRARQDRTRSFHFEWNTRLVQKNRRRTSVQNLHRALWVAGNDRFRFERALVGEGQNRWDHHTRDQRACDGSTNYVLEWLRGPSDPPQGAIRPAKGTPDLDNFECEAIFRALRPLDSPDAWQDAKYHTWHDATYHVVTQSAIVDGLHCVKLERTFRRMTESCWVDPNRDDLVVLCERTFRGIGSSIAISYHASPQFGWTPEHWTWRDQSGRDQSGSVELQCDATTSSVNERLPAKVFQINLPPGALVFDLAARKQYLIAVDGSRAAAPPFDSVSSPAFRRGLDAVIDVRFEPQPFNGAVEFLSRNYSLPFEFEIEAFRKAGLNIDETECHSDIEGLTLREQLRWLSAQLPKPIRLLEKDGKLVFTTASNSKPSVPNNQGGTKTK
jgi:hypothetical protein